MSKDHSAATPYYVLLEENQKFKPNILPLSTGQECRAVYGFSDQDAYKAFIASSKKGLTPYPLVKTYLRSLLDSAAQSKSLIIMDAVSETDPKLNAALVQTVFDAHQKKAPTIQSEFGLVHEEESNAYRLEELSSSVSSISPFKLP